MPSPSTSAVSNAPSICPFDSRAQLLTVRCLGSPGTAATTDPVNQVKGLLTGARGPVARCLWYHECGNLPLVRRCRSCRARWMRG